MDFQHCVNCNSEGFQPRKCDASEDFNPDCQNVVSIAFESTLTIQNIKFDHLPLCSTCSELSKRFCNGSKLFLKLGSQNSKISCLLKRDLNNINKVVNYVIANINQKSQNEDTILPDQEDYNDSGISIGKNELVKQENISEYQERQIKLEVCKLSEEMAAQFARQIYSNEKPGTVEENSKFYSCSTCDRKFSEPQLLNNHNNSTHLKIQENFSCSFCSKKFALVWFLKNHLKTRHNGIEVLHYCQTCKHKFYSKSDLKEHILKSHDVRKFPYKCKNCYESFKNIQDLRDHLLNYHEGSKEADAAEGNIAANEIQKLRAKQCSICKEILDTPDLLWNHRKLEHGEKGECEICHKEFLSLQSLNNHRQIHKSCPTCDKPFLSYKMMTCHYEAVHVPIVDLPFVCEMCGKKYSMERKLLNHYNWHVEVSGPKQFCNICNKAFKMKGHLKQHMRQTHTDSKGKHKCPFCNQMFSTKGNLNFHLEQIHNERLQFPCKICGRAFLNLESVRVHMRVHTHEIAFEKQTKTTKKLAKIVDDKLEVMACYSSETFLFTCPMCGKSSDSQTHFFRHLEIVHGLKGYADLNAKVSSSIKCPVCDKVFGRKDLLDKHKRRAHNITNKSRDVTTTPRSYDCPHCKQVIRDCTFAAFKAHVNRHEIFIVQKTEDNQTVKKEIAKFFNETDKNLIVLFVNAALKYQIF